MYRSGERNYTSVMGEPFAEEHYREGRALAARELGDLSMGQVIG